MALRGGFEDIRRCREGVVPEEGKESPQNRACGLPAELLVDDGVGQGVEGRETVGAQLGRTNSVNKPSHCRVASEMGYCVFAHRATITISERLHKA